MPYLHACIFASYNDVSGVVTRWKEKCVSLLVVEHPAEGKTQRVHCHFLIETPAGENWFRDQAKEIMGEYIKRGNYWIATRVQKGEHAGKLISRKETLVYILKKTHAVSFEKNFSPAEVEEARSGWVNQVNEIPSSDSLSDVMIRIVLKKYDWLKSYDDLANIQRRHDVYYGDAVSDAYLLFMDVRHETMSSYWAKQRKMPFPHQHKITAGTVYVTLMERIGLRDEAFKRLSHVWY